MLQSHWSWTPTQRWVVTAKKAPHCGRLILGWVVACCGMYCIFVVLCASYVCWFEPSWAKLVAIICEVSMSENVGKPRGHDFVPNQLTQPMKNQTWNQLVPALPGSRRVSTWQVYGSLWSVCDHMVPSEKHQSSISCLSDCIKCESMWCNARKQPVHLLYKHFEDMMKSLTVSTRARRICFRIPRLAPWHRTKSLFMCKYKYTFYLPYFY